MEETYTLEALILNRFAFREYDSKVVLYSREKGKLELVARGTKRTKSKIAGHIEPMNLIDGMAIRGRQYDYLGSAICRDAFAKIKNDYEKTMLAGRALRTVNQVLRPGVIDERIFSELMRYLILADNASTLKAAMLTDAFIIKFLSLLGYRPEVYDCVICRKKITPGKNHFNVSKGGIVCPECARGSSLYQIMISDDCIKIWRLAIEKDLTEIAKIKVEVKLIQEFSRTRDLYYKYIFDNITK